MVKLVINSVPTAPGGGLTNLLGLLEGWRNIDADLDITILASRPETIRELEASGWGPNTLRVPMMGTARRQLWIRYGLPRLLRRLGADLLLTNTFFVGGAPCPQVVHHQNLFTCFADGFSAYLKLGVRFLLISLGARWALRRADANVFISNHVRERSERLVPSSRPRNDTIYYGLSQRYRDAQPTSDGRDPFRLCAIQSPDDYKDTGSLLRALAQLVTEHPQHDWSLDLAGWGDFDAFKRLAAELGISDRVRWLGYQNPQQIADMLRRCAVLVYPSVFEGFGIPLIEAMASGCPVVAVNSTAIPEAAGDAAVLVPPRSPQEIARAVHQICTDGDFRERLVARGHARSRQFSWTRAARQFCRVFARVLHKPIRVDERRPQPATATAAADVAAVGLSAGA
ncbi:MAG: glycosyltransferase family 4 protein [Phycisphaerae bacterium]|nr:glycosyltransferase family 4 protein [Phycisphaerae bacterium]MCZ2398989.1 glycosyltransferase family 4 protein [Phycisphaerae bacterium]